jgi:hypothetical protein
VIEQCKGGYAFYRQHDKEWQTEYLGEADASFTSGAEATLSEACIFEFFERCIMIYA